MTQPSEPTEAHHDEVPPEVQDYLDVDQAQEDAEFERLHQRNRKRILIPLGLLIALCIILSFFGDPIPTPAPETSQPTGTTP